MKRIVSLGLAALILLGTVTGVLMMIAYAADKEETSSSGIFIESYYYRGSTLTLTLIDTNVEYVKDTDFSEFYASLLSSDFYPSSGGSIISEIPSLKNDADKNLRFTLTFSGVNQGKTGANANFRMYYTYNGVDYNYNISANLNRYLPDTTPSIPDVDKPEVNPAVATPYILVQNYNYGGTDVAAGSEFSLSVNFYNTSSDVSLENIIMKVEPTAGLSITGASNTYYIPSLGKKGAVTKSIPLKCLNSATPGSESVHITFSYEYVSDDVRSAKSSEETISIPILQVERFEVELGEVPSTLYPGENNNVTITYVNKGRSDLFNLTARIEGNIDDQNQVQNLGNIKAGDSGTAKFAVSSMEPGGTVSCIIHVSYENEKGTVTTISKEFTCPVYDNSGDMMNPGLDPGLDPMEPTVEETGMRWWQKVLFGAGCLAVGGVSGTWIFLKTKMKREEADDEDI